MTPSASESRTGRGAFARAIRLGRILGIEIFVHWSLVFIFVLVLLNLGLSLLPSWHPDWGSIVTWTTASGAALLFFASVLAHELSHSVVARTEGIRVEGITLFLFGGVSQMKDEPPTPRAEFLMAVVGPLTSLGIGVVATLAGAWGTALEPNDLMSGISEALRTMSPIRTLLLWLGPINVLLGLFNLIPGFPLDGGRVFRSALWWITGDVVKATRWAAGFGQLVGWLLVFTGFMNLFGGVSAQGLWLILIGWFLINAAGMSYQHMFLNQTLRHVRVSDIMRNVRSVEPDLIVQSFVDDFLMQTDQTAYPVLVNGALTGVVRLRDVQKIPREKWPWTRVADIMTPAEELTTLDSTMTASRAAELLSAVGTELPVVERSEFVGMVEQQDVLRWITLHPPPSRDDGGKAQARNP